MKNIDKDTLVRWLMTVLIILGGVVAFVLIYDKVLPALGHIISLFGVLVFPFAIAWLVAIITRPVVNLFVDKLHFPRTLAVILLMLMILMVFTMVGMLVVSVVNDLLNTISDYVSNVNQYKTDFMAYIRQLYERLSLDIGPLQQYVDMIKADIGQLASSGMGWMISVAKGTPAVFVIIFISLVAVFYWCRDEEKIKKVIAGFFPIKHRQSILDTYNSFSTVIGGYVRAQLLLVSLSVIICMTGFTIIGTESPLARGLMTGVMDVIPVLGPGSMIIPWAIWSLISGDTFLGIGLLITYGVTTISRYILEPKLVGDRIGLHPLAALAAVFIGMELFGLVGLIMGPIILAVLVAFFAERKSKKFAAAVSAPVKNKGRNGNDGNSQDGPRIIIN